MNTASLRYSWAHTLAMIGGAFCLIALSACGVLNHRIKGSGHTVTREFDFTGFSQVAIGNSFEAELTASPQYRVAVTVDDNLLDYLDVIQSGDTLKIRLKSNVNVQDATLRAVVNLPQLAGLDLSGATSTHVTGFTSAQPLQIDLSGASSLHGDLRSGAARLDLSGASRVALKGSAESLKVDASGASSADLEQYPTQDATIAVQGASHIVVHATGALDVTASGASSVRYVGHPARLTSRTSGASRVAK